MDFTTVYFNYNVYTNNKIQLKKIISKHGLKWIPSKMKMGISWNEICEVAKFFKVEDRVIEDKNLVGRNGSTGMWESSSEAIKIFMFDKKVDSEHLPVLIVYKRNIVSEKSSIFYNEFVSECIKLGCEIGKLIEDEGKLQLIFKKRVNIELAARLDTVEGSKEVVKEMFINRISELGNIGYKFSSSFIEGWKKCIDKYGIYTDKMLYDEFDNINKKREDEKIKIDMIGTTVENKIIHNSNIISARKKTIFKINRVNTLLY